MSTSEIHSLASASHVPVHGCLEKSGLVLTEAEDDGEHDEEACVVLKLAEECKSSFEKFDSRSYLNSVEDTGEEEDG
jgi:hypothetical protein